MYSDFVLFRMFEPNIRSKEGFWSRNNNMGEI